MMGLLSSKTSLSHHLYSLLFLLLACSSSGDPLYQSCSNTDGNYTANSTYEANLNLLLFSLSSNGSASGFFNDTKGDIPNRVYGLVLCRGDVKASDCKSCLGIAREGVVQVCPYNKGAIVWYDYCLLRYSNLFFFSSIGGNSVYMWNEQNVTELDLFNNRLDLMMDALVNYSVKNSSTPRLFATGQVNFTTDFPLIYGLMQCTRDLSADQCSQCLQGFLGEGKSMLSGKEEGRILGPSCNFWYDLYPFYNGTALVSIPLLTMTKNTTPPVNSTIPNLPTPGSYPTTQENRKEIMGPILSIAVPVVLGLMLSSAICIFLWRRKLAKKLHYRANQQEIIPTRSLFINLSTLRIATDNFSNSNKLGEGGFGVVYKGTLSDGQEIAVKRLSTKSGQGLKELKAEVGLLAKLQHRNLVKLLGVCLEKQENLLVYEFVPNKSLDTFLFDPTKYEELYWGRRYKIIRGIARGLLYLHEDSRLKVIHRDLKASNILLDVDMNAKISDFGLAKLFGVDQTQANTTQVVGTYGYMAPEYVMRGQYSNKSDVFSFGVIVIEIVSGKKNSHFSDSESSVNLLSYVWKHWNNETVLEIVDPSLGEHFLQSEVLRCIQIGLLCVQEAPADRPTMSSVVHMLNSYSTLQFPSQPAFLFGLSELSSGRIDQSTSKSMLLSRNELSVTELDPR